MLSWNPTCHFRLTLTHTDSLLDSQTAKPHHSQPSDTRLELSDTDSPNLKNAKKTKSDEEFAMLCAEFLKDENQPPIAKLMAKSLEKFHYEVQQEITMLKSLAAASKWEDEFTEHRHKRSIVITGLIESNSLIASQRLSDDEKTVQDILDKFDIEVRPFSVFRMGVKNPNKPRLVKVEFPSKSIVAKVMKSKSTLKSDKNFAKIYIRPSMNRTEREERRKLQVECNLKNQQNTDSDPQSQFVIYAGVVTQRRDIVKRH